MKDPFLAVLPGVARHCREAGNANWFVVLIGPWV